MAALAPGNWSSTSELIVYAWWTQLLPIILAGLLGCLLSGLVVAQLHERRAIPVVVLLTNLLANRLGLYESAAVTSLERWPRLVAAGFSLTTQLWLARVLFSLGSLLLLLGPVLFRRRRRAACP